MLRSLNLARRRDGGGADARVVRAKEVHGAGEPPLGRVQTRQVVLARTTTVKVLAHAAKTLPSTWMPSMLAGEQNAQCMCKEAMKVREAAALEAVKPGSLLREASPYRQDQTQLVRREDGEGGSRQSTHQFWLCLPRAEPC